MDDSGGDIYERTSRRVRRLLASMPQRPLLWPAPPTTVSTPSSTEGRRAAASWSVTTELFYSHKDLGLISDVLTKDVMNHFPDGTMAVGHVRYGTTGANNRNNCQPIQVNHQKGKLALAHNGNLSNAFQLRSELELNGAIFHSTSDTEIIAYIVTQERLKTPSIEDALCQAMYRLEARLLPGAHVRHQAAGGS